MHATQNVIPWLGAWESVRNGESQALSRPVGSGSAVVCRNITQMHWTNLSLPNLPVAFVNYEEFESFPLEIYSEIYSCQGL